MTWILRFLTLLLFLIPSITAEASWQRLSLTGAGVGAQCGFFFNEMVGFVGINGNRGIHKTTDGGKTWRKATLSPSTLAGDFTSIFMTDTLRGWATMFDQNLDMIFKTTDGGLTWVSTGQLGGAVHVHETPSAITVTGWYSQGKLSTDKGVTWQSNVFQSTNGVDFVDDLHGAISAYETGRWLHTSNGGVTWQQSMPDNFVESWGIYGVKGTSNFFAAPELNPGLRTGSSFIRRSTDFGATWSTLTNIPVRTTGHLHGVGNVMYFQCDEDPLANPSASGLYRSTDFGVTWVPVGGPSNEDDTRFFVTGCNGGVVYAFDKLGGVWKTRDGGDGQIVEPPVEPSFKGAPIVFSELICDSSNAAFAFQNLYCLGLNILDIRILDSTSLAITSGALSVRRRPTLPRLLGTGESDSILFEWIPSRGFHSDTAINVRVRVTFTQAGLGTRDTVVTISARALGAPAKPGLSIASILRDTTRACTPVDTLITITNNGCDTLWISSFSSTPRPGLELLALDSSQLKLPYAIPPGTASSFILRIDLHLAEDYISGLKLTSRHQGVSSDTVIDVRTYVPFPLINSLPKNIDFGNVSTCRSLDSLLAIPNTRCDPITIEKVTFKTGTLFSRTNSGTYPVVVSPDSTHGLIVNFNPGTSGPKADSVIIELSGYGVSRRIAIGLKGTGVLGDSRYASNLAVDTIDFQTFTRCDLADSLTFNLLNPGCTPLRIDSVVLQNSLFPVVAQSLKPQLPQTIIDGDTVRVKLKVTPDRRGDYFGTVRVFYQMQGDAPKDSTYSVHVKVIPGRHWLEIDTTPVALNEIGFCETSTTTIRYRNPGCDSLLIDQRNVTGPGFAIANSQLTPRNLAPGAEDSIRVSFIPVISGLNTGEFLLSTDGDSGATQVRIPITINVIPTDTIGFKVIPEKPTIEPGDGTSLLLIPTRSSRRTGLRRIDLVLTYNGDIITYAGPTTVTVPNAGLANPVFENRPGTSKFATLPIAITSNTDIQLDSLTPIATIPVRITLSDSIQTPVTITDLAFNAPDKNYGKCTQGGKPEFNTVTVAIACGDSTIIKYFLNKSFMMSAHPVEPNPSTGSAQVSIPITLSAAQDVSLRVFDPAGNLYLEQRHSFGAAGEYRLSLEGTSFPAGTYQYVITSRLSGDIIAGKFVVLR